MGRVLNTNSGTKVRNHALRNLSLVLRELASRETNEEERMDMGAFIVLNLHEIQKSVDQSATAWEKRDYWVKADHFRMAWQWAEGFSNRIEELLRLHDWSGLSKIIADLAGKIGSIEPLKRQPLDSPWKGSWKALHSK